jgi:hypothetical protein
MPRITLIGALAVLFVFGLGTPSAAALEGNCWGKLKKPLDRGGFGVGTDCNFYNDLEVHYLGRTNGRTKFRVYNTIWGLLPVYKGGPIRGGDRLIIFDDHMKYLGYYRFDVPDGNRAWLKGATVYIGGPASEGNKLPLDGPTLPSKAWLQGYDLRPSY